VVVQCYFNAQADVISAAGMMGVYVQCLLGFFLRQIKRRGDPSAWSRSGIEGKKSSTAATSEYCCLNRGEQIERFGNIVPKIIIN
jgi:hypothetical protein